MSKVLYAGQGRKFEALKVNFMTHAKELSLTPQQLDHAFRTLVSTQSFHIDNVLAYGIANAHHRLEGIRLVDSDEAMDAIVTSDDPSRGKCLTFLVDGVRITVISTHYYYEDCFAYGIPFPEEWDPHMGHEVFTIYVKPASV